MARDEPNGWLSSNALRNYPFKEDAFRLPLSGGALPTGVILDLAIATPYTLLVETTPNVESFHIPPSFKLTRVDGTVPGVIKFVFSELLPGALPETNIAEVSITLATFVPLAPYKLTGLIPATHGVIVFGEALLTYAPNVVGSIYVFPDESGFLQERTVKDNPYSRVMSVSELGDPTLLVGDVKLEEGYNIDLEFDVANNAIRINAFVGAGLGRFCGAECDDPADCSGAIYSINGIRPDELGRFLIKGEKFALVASGTHKVTVDTVIAPGDICTRTGDPGDPGPTGASGPAGAGGGAGAIVCCFCDICQVCDTCQSCNTSEGWMLCGMGDHKFYPPPPDPDPEDDDESVYSVVTAGPVHGYGLALTGIDIRELTREQMGPHWVTALLDLDIFPCIPC
jgi:hypothetical protein